MEIDKSNLTTKEKRSIVKYISNIFFGEANTFILEHRVLIAASVIAFLGTLIGLIWDLFLGLPLVLNIIVGFFTIVYFLLFYYSRFRNGYNPKIFVFLSLLFLSLLYCLNGGLNGSIPILYIVFMAVFITISNSKSQKAFLIVTLLTFLSLVLGEFFLLKDYVIQYSTNGTREMDLIFGYSASIVIIYFIIKYFKNIITSKNFELNKLNASKDLLFNIIAHDLKSPISNILGYSNLMTDKSKELSLEKFQSFSETINIETKRATELLDSLLIWGEIQKDKVQIKQQAINLYKTAVEVLDYFNQNNTDKGVNIKIEIPNDIIVYADIVVLKIILRNLISNGIKFTHQGGEILISVEHIKQKKIAIIVKDTGIGMDQEFIDNLFLTEINTNRNGTQGEKSNGLGLIIIKELVKMLGGELIIESQINQGSTFKFTVLKAEEN